MDRSCGSITDFWTSFKPVVPYTPAPDTYQPKPEPTTEYPSYFDIETFYDNVANGNGSTCYVKHDYPFSWELASDNASHSFVQTDDGPLDPNNNNNSYCDLTPYQYAGNILQVDPSSSVAQEVVVYTFDESTLSAFEQPITEHTEKDPLAVTDSVSIMEEACNLDTIKLELPEDVKYEPPKAKGMPVKAKSPSKLPLKKRRLLMGYFNPSGKYACPSCDRTFNRQGHLTQHCNAHHSGPMDQRCATCGKRFRLPEDLQRHQLRHKEQNKSFSCEHCPKKFNYKFDMIRHVKAVHTEAPHKCQFCGKGVVRYDHLLLHENKHRRMMNNVTGRQRAASKRRKVDDGDSVETTKIEQR